MVRHDNPYSREYLAELGGAKSIDIVGLLGKCKEIDEFKLADKLKMDVKAIRRVLYKLYEKKLVSFRKTRDEERGWYIYIWRLEKGKLGELLDKKKEDAIDTIRCQLNYEQSSQFFKCENGCMRVPFEKAFEMAFVCPDCKSKLEFFDNTAIVQQLKKYISKSGRIGG